MWQTPKRSLNYIGIVGPLKPLFSILKISITQKSILWAIRVLSCLLFVSLLWPTPSFSVMKSALGSVHGVDVIEKQVSGYYIADEISATYRGMMIAIDDAHWVVFSSYVSS